MKKSALLVLVCLLATVTTGCKVKVKKGGRRNNGQNQQGAQQGPLQAPAAPVDTTGTAPLGTPVTGGLPAAPTAAVINGAEGRKLDGLVDSIMKKEGAFHGTVLVARDGQVLLDRGYNVANDAMWDWASIGKQFTSAAILKLAMQGRLSVDDPMSKLFPETPADKRGITLRHLLTHTSGIDQDTLGALRGDDAKSLVASFNAAKIATQPGTKFDYCNPGYGMLAAAVERASGQKYEDYLKANLFRPAGMRDASFIGQADLPVARVPLSDRGQGPRFAYGDTLGFGYKGAGGAVASAREMLAWDAALRGDTILDDRSRGELYRVALEGYALGWFVRADGGDEIYEHSGSVGKNVFQYVRTRDSKVVIAIACAHESQAVGELVEALLSATRAPQA